jgi:hypothetical protein
MPCVRRVAAPIAAIWLLLQTTTLLAVPAVIWAASRTPPIECTCVHDGDHEHCPMHHRSPAEAQICFTSTGSTEFAALGTLLGQIGVSPAAPVPLDLASIPLASTHPDSGAITRSISPEPHPPRS